MRKNSYLVALIVYWLCGAACGSNDRQDLPKLHVWHFWSAPHHNEALQELVRQFEKQHRCRVELTPLSWNDGKTKLMAAFNSGTAPDVLELGSDWIAQFSSSGVLQELPENVVAPERWLPWSLSPCRWQGRYYALPWVVDTRVLFVNRTLLDSAGMTVPTTLDQLLRTCAAVQERTTAAGFGAVGADEHRLYKRILPLMWTLGGDVLDSTSRCVLFSEANVQALELYATLARNGIIDTQKQLDAAFVRGQIALWQSGSWLLEKIRNEHPSLAYSVVTLPGLDGKTPGISFAGGEYWAISRTCQHPNLAQAFISFMSDGPQATRFCHRVSEAGFPAHRQYFADTTLTYHPAKSVFALQLQYARMTPVHPRWLEIERILENTVVDVLYGRSDARTALRTAHTQIVELLKR